MGISPRGLLCFALLVMGSTIFVFSLPNELRTTGSGDHVILTISAVKRGITALAHYLVFVSIVFGIYFFLRSSVSKGMQADEAVDHKPAQNPGDSL